jgi:hypothetical protein
MLPSSIPGAAQTFRTAHIIQTDERPSGHREEVRTGSAARSKTANNSAWRLTPTVLK